jgi:uncharacterized membrane protein YgcG
MANGNVLVNDTKGRRVLLFDSTLSRPRVVADTTSATSNAYGRNPGPLIRYRGDSALFVDRSSLSMFVVTPSGAIARIMAIPRANDAQALLNLGTPGLDARGRLVYFAGLFTLPSMIMFDVGGPVPTPTGPLAEMFKAGRTDSAFIVRVDLTTRVLDTVAAMRAPKMTRSYRTDARGMLQAIEVTPDPLPLVDAWAIFPDGSLAIVRARDYHVDWLDVAGRWSSTPKMPFDWVRVPDDRKETLIDSTVKAWQANYDKALASRRPGAGSGSSGSAGGRGGGGGGGGGGQAAPVAPTIVLRPALGELPDYWPPLTQEGAPPVHADADGNLWIRTTTMIKGQPVYDIVNRRGELVDRVQLPSFRTIAGFGPSVVYMAMLDSTGAVHLERARVK